MSWIERPRDVLRQVREAARVYDTSVWQQLRRLYHLRSHHRFPIDEAILWRLTDPAIPEQHLGRYPSPTRMISVKQRVNLYAARPDMRNKTRFYRLCAERGLPVPVSHGVHRVPGAEYRAEPTAKSVDLGSLPDGNYVAKPVRGEQGMDLVFFDKSGGRFEAEGQVLDAPGLRARLDRDKHWSSDYLVQRCLQPHPELAALSGGPGLQCLRIVTYLDLQGRVHVLYARFKMIDRGNLVDNFHKGARGNLVADVDLDSGRVVMALAKAPDETVVRPVTHHPSTGRPLRIALPDWPAILDLARNAALAFPDLRCVGWDIAPTAEGPVLIEGNVDWYAFPFAPYRKPDAPEWDRLTRGEPASSEPSSLGPVGPARAAS